MRSQPDLFYVLMELTGCQYLSDLQALPHPKVRHAVKQLPAAQFPARDWIDALCYFSDQHFWSDSKVHMLSATAARRALLRCLRT